MVSFPAKMESKDPPTKDCSDIFKWKQMGSEFSVFIPEQMRGSWIKKLHGVYYTATKSWHFLTNYVTDVEHHLGLKAGESGIRDSRYYFKITFEAEISGPDGFDKLRKQLESRGIIWDRHKETFRAKFGQIPDLETDLIK